MDTAKRLEPLRRMKKAKPDRNILRQQLQDEKRRIGIHFGNFLVLSEEGSLQQMEFAKQKARNEVMKIGPTLTDLAKILGEKYTALVTNYLDTISLILYDSSKYLDEAKTTRFFNAEQKLEKAIRKE